MLAKLGCRWAMHAGSFTALSMVSNLMVKGPSTKPLLMEILSTRFSVKLAPASTCHERSLSISNHQLWVSLCTTRILPLSTHTDSDESYGLVSVLWMLNIEYVGKLNQWLHTFSFDGPVVEVKCCTNPLKYLQFILSQIKKKSVDHPDCFKKWMESLVMFVVYLLFLYYYYYD